MASGGGLRAKGRPTDSIAMSTRTQPLPDLSLSTNRLAAPHEGAASVKPK